MRGPNYPNADLLGGYDEATFELSHIVEDFRFARNMLRRLGPEERRRFSAAGRDCVAYPVLGCPAKLSQHNTARIRLRNARLQRPEYSTSASGAASASTHSLAEDRFCYGCRAAIADGAGLCATAHCTADTHAQGCS